MTGSTGPITCAMHMTDGLLHLKPNLLEVWDKGCAELYEELGQYAEDCLELYEHYWDSGVYGSPGVYDYEVSCEFGDWFGKYILENGGEAPSNKEAMDKLQTLALDFFKQAEEFTNRKES